MTELLGESFYIPFTQNNESQHILYYALPHRDAG
jgi:hypothetical protein